VAPRPRAGGARKTAGTGDDLSPKQQMLIKTPDDSKVGNLNVDWKSYWLCTNDPFDNRKREEAFDAHGLEKGLEVLAGTAF